ncbi:hypothetical protein ACLOJK_038700 [Asimina triloba]
MGEVDLAFVQAIEHRPKLKVVEAGGIPLIDLSPLNSISISISTTPDADGLRGLIAEVGAACRDWGFFQVINHGVPTHLRTRIESEAKKFFDLPLETKRGVRRDEVNPLGYYDTEHTKNVRDWKEVFDYLLRDPTFIPASHEPHDPHLQELKNQWPAHQPELREAATEYAQGVEVLAFKLLQLISLSLGLPANRLDGFFGDQTSFFRLNHYPPCPAPHLALGVGRHKDAGALTVLAQDDVGGLEVKRRTDGEWIKVKPIPDSFIINVGDIVQVWSNDRYESAEHRVRVNSEKERFSIPFFFNPAHYTMVKPIDELVSEKNPPKYREYNWGKFFKTRKLSNFKKLDVENIQIYHFKISA